jgi:D-alanyl-D-alanine dipeptidase
MMARVSVAPRVQDRAVRDGYDPRSINVCRTCPDPLLEGSSVLPVDVDLRSREYAPHPWRPLLGIPRAPDGALVALRGVHATLHYALQGLPGAPCAPALHPAASTRLAEAVALLNEATGLGDDLRLGIWDAHRSIELQSHLFGSYAADLALNQGLSLAEARRAAVRYVAPPWEVFPHGTGGAVDVTLCETGQELDLGTGFDGFGPQASPTFPWGGSGRDAVVVRNRGLLVHVMTAAGFVQDPEEWWHFEWGTQMWAEQTGLAPVLTTVQRCAVPCEPVPAPAGHTVHTRSGHPEAVHEAVRHFRAERRTMALQISDAIDGGSLSVVLVCRSLEAASLVISGVLQNSLTGLRSLRLPYLEPAQPGGAADNVSAASVLAELNHLYSLAASAGVPSRTTEEIL